MTTRGWKIRTLSPFPVVSSTSTSQPAWGGERKGHERDQRRTERGARRERHRGLNQGTMVPSFALGVSNGRSQRGKATRAACHYRDKGWMEYEAVVATR